MSDKIEALRELAGKATPGPWTIWAEPTPNKTDAIAEFAYQVENTENFSGTTWLLNADGLCPASTGCGATSEANAAFIAAASPDVILSLLSELDRLRSSNEAMRKAADRLVESELAAKVRSLVAGWNGEDVPQEYRFGRHPDVLGVTLPTDCGSIYMLDEVLAEFRSTLKEEDAR